MEQGQPVAGHFQQVHKAAGILLQAAGPEGKLLLLPAHRPVQGTRLQERGIIFRMRYLFAGTAHHCNSQQE